MLKHSLSIAVAAAALLGTSACERNVEDDTTKARDTAVEGARVGDDRPRTDATGQRLSPEMQKRFDEAQERYNRLERRASDAKRDVQSRGVEVRSDLDADVERAKNNVKTKLEAARKASAENAQRAIDELDAALTDLDDRLGEYNKT